MSGAGVSMPAPLLAVWALLAVMAVLMVVFQMSPTQRLVRRLRPVWDGAGVTKSEVVGVGDKRRTVRHRPSVSGLKKLDGQALSFIVRPNPGMTVEDIVGCADAIRDALRVQEVKAVPLGGGRVRVEVYRRGAEPEKFGLADLSGAYGGLDSGVAAGVHSGRLLLGRDDSGALRWINLGHTLVVGATGSGKGSVLWRYVMSAVDVFAASGGGVRLFGIDPKRAELAGVDGAFERVAFDGQDILEVLEDVLGVMKQRQQEGRRSFVHDEEHPLVLLVIDEFNALGVMEDRKGQAAVKSALQQILSQGRSAGVYVLAAAQQPQKELLGAYRPHFMNRICLRVESAQEVDMVLGVGAVEMGAVAHQIAPATESNGYSTAGLAYVRTDGEPAPVRVRAPYVSDEDILHWVEGIEAKKGTSHGC